MTLRTTHADASTLRGADDSSSNPATPFIKEEDPGTPSLRPLRTAQHEEYSVSSPTTTFDDVDRSIDDRFSELNSRSPTHFLDSPACPLATHRPPEPTPPSYSAAEVVRPPDFVGRTSNEALPRYAEEAQTEPKTLARGLWRWGWVCPLLWAIGMTM